MIPSNILVGLIFSSGGEGIIIALSKMHIKKMTHGLYFSELSVKHFVYFPTSDIPRQAGVRTEEEGPVWSAPPFGILDRRTVIVIHGKTLINPDISETLIEKTLINGHPSIIQLIKPNNSFEPKKVL